MKHYTFRFVLSLIVVAFAFSAFMQIDCDAQFPLKLLGLIPYGFFGILYGDWFRLRFKEKR